MHEEPPYHSTPLYTFGLSPHSCAFFSSQTEQTRPGYLKVQHGSNKSSLSWTPRITNFRFQEPAQKIAQQEWNVQNSTTEGMPRMDVHSPCSCTQLSQYTYPSGHWHRVGDTQTSNRHHRHSPCPFMTKDRERTDDHRSPFCTYPCPLAEQTGQPCAFFKICPNLETQRKEQLGGDLFVAKRV